MLCIMKEHTPTPELRTFVREATSARISQDKICRLIGISSPTLRLYYRVELDHGSIDIPKLAINRIREFLELKPEGRYSAAMQEKQAKVALEALKSHGFSSSIDLNVNKELPRIVTEVVAEDSSDE